MKKISQNQMKMLEDVLKTTLREALSEEIDALFAARTALRRLLIGNVVR